MRASVYPAGRGTGLTCVSRRAACSSAAEEEKSCPLLVFLPDKAGSTPVSQIFFSPLCGCKNKQDGEYPVVQLLSIF